MCVIWSCGVSGRFIAPRSPTHLTLQVLVWHSWVLRRESYCVSQEYIFILTFHSCLSDPYMFVWLYMILISLKCSSVCQAYGYFTPIILIGLGFSVKDAQLLVGLFERTFSSRLLILVVRLPRRLSVPPCLLSLWAGWQTGTEREDLLWVLDFMRNPHGTNTNLKIVFQSLLAITGLSLTAFHPNSSVGPYVSRIRTEDSLTQCQIGSFRGCVYRHCGIARECTCPPCLRMSKIFLLPRPLTVPQQSNNIRRQSKRSFASAFQVAFAGVGASRILRGRFLWSWFIQKVVSSHQ